MRIATWNVNSLRVRLPQLLEWLAASAPDVVALQETKLTDDAFPADELRAAGYHCVYSGQKTYNGVATLARTELHGALRDIPGYDDPQRRVLAASVAGVRVINLYVPNGQSVDSDKYHYKLGWLRALRSWLRQELAAHAQLVVLGDFNIAPEDRDVYDPTAFEGATHVSPLERDALARLHDWGLIDVFRRAHDASSVYSWWDYRAGDFHQGRGLRIDLVLATAPVADRVEWTIIDRNARKGQQPSDHAPVVVDLAEAAV